MLGAFLTHRAILGNLREIILGGADLKSFTAQNADVFVPITGADNSKECLCGGSYLSSDPQSYTLISARYLNHSKNDGRDHMGHRLFYVPQD